MHLPSNTTQQPQSWPDRFYFSIDPSAYGATGRAPQDKQLSPQAVTNALAVNAQQASLPSGPLGIPGVVLDAYLKAERAMAVQQPSCHLPWWLLAGIGKIESNQAGNGYVDTYGTTLRPILGPVLDGSNGFAAIPATSGWARAQGPMQFLPSSWVRYGGGGDINNIYDAALAAGRYLCSSGLDLSVPANQAAAVFSYNHSNAYVQSVLTWAYAYQRGVTPVAQTPVPISLVGFNGSNPVLFGGLPVLPPTTDQGSGSSTNPSSGSSAPGTSNTPTSGSTPGQPGPIVGSTAPGTGDPSPDPSGGTCPAPTPPSTTDSGSTSDTPTPVPTPAPPTTSPTPSGDTSTSPTPPGTCTAVPAVG